MNPLEFAALASTLLIASWNRPGLINSPEYVRWQAGFPAEHESIAVLAEVDGQAAGFASLLARTFRLGTQTIQGWILSFVCVLPAFRGRGIADEMYRLLLDHLESSGRLAIVYVGPSSPGERVLQRALGKSRLAWKSLGECASYGLRASPPSGITNLAVIEDPATGFERLSDGLSRFTAKWPTSLCSNPNSDQVRHIYRDPRLRRLICASHDDISAGTAWLVHNVAGESAYATVEVPLCDSEHHLPAIMRAAANSIQAGFSLAPNLSVFEQSTLQQLGLRRVPAAFATCVMSPQAELVQSITSVNTMVV